MTVKASGCSALILVTGLLLGLAAPSQAAVGADDAATAKPEKAGAPVTLHKFARHGTQHSKKVAHRKAGKVAQRPDHSGKTADAADDGDRSPTLPPAVANANAQLASAEPPTGHAARALSAEPASDAEVVAPDQLNDVDRALRETPPANAPATLTMAAAETPAAPAPAAAAPVSDNAWDQTSLIGKIFIGFGALLTLASAARMFMA